MVKPKLEGQNGTKMNPADKAQLSDELNSLLKDLAEPCKFSFDGRASTKVPLSAPEAVTIKLNAGRTLLCFEYDKKESEIENDKKIIEEQVYNHVRTTLQDKKVLIQENKWDESFKLAKQQMLSYLIKETKLDDKENFLREFQQFINELPEVPNEFFECYSKLMEINFDDWDIEDSDENDPRCEAISGICKNMKASFERNDITFSGSNINTQEENQKYDDALLPGISSELLTLEKKYPKQVDKIKRLFEIMNTRERGAELDKQLEIIAMKLGLSQSSANKIMSYFNVREIKHQKGKFNESDDAYWYTDEDTNCYGRVLENHGVNVDTQFSNRLTEDGINTLPSIESLKENNPKYICYNIGGKANKDNSGIHWIAIVLVKRGEKVTILYKDSKKDWNSSSNAVESLFKKHYKNEVDFIKHTQAEQEDDASCGPMTINNLEIMALKVKEANHQGKDGIGELIGLFKGEAGGIAFTTQGQVQSIRISHSLYKKSYSLANLKQDTNADDRSTIIKKLKLSQNDTSMKDGKSFNQVTIEGDGNCFYSAVADQLRGLDIKVKNSEANNQPEVYYTHEVLRAFTIDYITENREQTFGNELAERLKAQNSNPLHADLPSNIHTFDQYIAHHSREGTWADSGIITALAQALEITLRIYHPDGMPWTYNAAQDVDSTVKKIVNLQYTGNHYDSLVEVDTEVTISKKKEQIESYIHKIDNYYDRLKDWRIDELINWSSEHKGQLSQNFGDSMESEDKICETIAVLDRANEVATGGQRLRDTQKAAVLIFMQTNTKGHISQINTGEGKTTIVSVVGALKVMQGYKVHVITSNNVLAADGVKDKKIFYDLLNITTAVNNPDDKYTDGPRACYSKDIVYGSITSFQFDWLRDSFERLNTLGGIDFNNVWVMLDEIDSLLIDQGSNIAKLSGPFPGMESLRYVYINIWVALAKTEEKVIDEMSVKLKLKAKELNEEGSKIDDDEKQLKHDKYADSLKENYYDEIKNHVKNQKNNLIHKNILPKHLHQYAEDSFERWIEHAFNAKYLYSEKIEYKISKDKDGENIITPIDNQNTGVSMNNTILANGLHQFLQIKHNLCLTYESLTSCYVSNLDYIKKYSSKLSGVTGTLGSQPERNLLGLVFNLEFSVIPPFKPKQFMKFPGKVSVDVNFVNDVAVAALGELTRTQIDDEYLDEKQQIERGEIRKPRAVLIICASILDVELLAEEIDRVAKAAGLTPNILKYRDESDAHITERTLEVCDIVIATNLAGRGTDFKTSTELECNYGLHVIEAFLPCNKRVEDQGFGRTGRQGNEGTGQIIIKTSELEALGIAVNSNNIDFFEIMQHRDALETKRLNDIADRKITELEFKGQLFNRFSLEYGKLKENSKIGTNVIQWIYVLRDLKEKWAFWLEKQAYTAESIKKTIAKHKGSCSKAVEEEYNKFLNEAKPIINGTICHNPFYSICLAEKYLENSSNESDRNKAALELEHALEISESSDLLYSAYINLFEIAIEDGGQLLKRFYNAVESIFPIMPSLKSYFQGYKTRARENLQKAAKALAIEYEYIKELIEGKKTVDGQHVESILASIIIHQEQEPGTIENQKTQGAVCTPNVFVKHLQSRFACLGVFLGNIESLIEQINGENVFGNPKDAIGPNDGAIISVKVPRHLSKLESQREHKIHVTDRSVNELAYVGMSSVFQLRKIHDVHEEVLNGARIQLAGAYVLLASAGMFPVALPVLGPLAGAMISESITDIITALIQQGESAFNASDYVKGKVISYGITLLTVGIGCIMSSTKILTKAINACKSLATKLRAVKGPFAGVCKLLAGRLDKLVIYLETLKETIEFARKTAKVQTQHLCKLKDTKQFAKVQHLRKSLKTMDVVTNQGGKIARQAAFGAVKGVAISVATEKIVIASLNNLMASFLKTYIEEKVHCAIDTRIKSENNKGTFNNVSEQKINQVIQKLNETTLEEDIAHVSKEIALGILRHSSNWKMQLATLFVESVLSVIDIAKCTNTVCDKFVEDLKKQTSTNAEDYTHNAKIIEGLVNNISGLISTILCNKIVAIVGKGIVTLPQIAYRGYQKHQEKKTDDKAIADMRNKSNQIDAADDAAKAANTNCGNNATAESLGYDSKQLADATNLAASENGTSAEDVKHMYEQCGINAIYCGEEDALSQFAKQDSDRATVCLSGDQVPGHMVCIIKEGNCLVAKEGNKTIPLDQYMQNHGYTNAKFVIPEGVNSTTLPDVQHRCNLNRIVKATHPLGYVGQDGGMKYGTNINSNNRHKIGRSTKKKKEAKQIKKDKEIEKKQKQNEEKPTLGTKGSRVLKASDGCQAHAEMKVPGHGYSHSTHIGFSDKECHTVFVHGKDQQNYLADMAGKDPTYIAAVNDVIETKTRKTVIIPIEALIKNIKSPNMKRKYMQASLKEKGAPRNMKSVTFVIDPADPDALRPYHIHTMFAVMKNTITK